MLDALIKSIRDNDMSVFNRIILNAEGYKIIDDTFNLNAQDFQMLQLCNKNADDLKKLSAIADARPIFLTILYNRHEMYKALLAAKINPNVSMGGKSLYKFSLCANYTCYFSDLIDTHPHLIGSSSSQGAYNMQYASRSFSEAEALSPLAKFTTAAKKGDLALVKAYCESKTFKQDQNGDALYEALAGGHTKCATAIKQAYEDANIPVQNRHYYAAGLAGEKSREVYNVLIPQQYNKVRSEPPQFIKDGNLDNLKNAFSAASIQERSDWLLQAIQRDHLNCVHYLLKRDVAIESRHYYSAGKLSERDPQESHYFYRLLQRIDTGELARNEIEVSKRFSPETVSIDEFLNRLNNAFTGSWHRPH